MAGESRHFEGGVEQMGYARSWLETRLREASVDGGEIDAILLAFTEAYANILRHAYDGRLPAPLDVALRISPAAVTLVLRDEGRRFQPKGVSVPAPEALEEGGYGLFLIEALMDEVTYAPAGAAGTELRLSKRRRAHAA